MRPIISLLWVWWEGLRGVIHAAERDAEDFALFLQLLPTAALTQTSLEPNRNKIKLTETVLVNHFNVLTITNSGLVEINS